MSLRMPVAGEELQLGDRPRSGGDDGERDAVQERAATDRVQVVAGGQRAAMRGGRVGGAAERDPQVPVTRGGEPPHMTRGPHAVVAERDLVGRDGRRGGGIGCCVGAVWREVFSASVASVGSRKSRTCAQRSRAGTADRISASACADEVAGRASRAALIPGSSEPRPA
jgi:hypothetical protein